MNADDRLCGKINPNEHELMNSSTQNKPAGFCDSRLIRIGIVLFMIGSGPLIFIIFAAKLGWTDDPNPNPAGFGILAMLTFCPGIALIIAGIISILFDKKLRQPESQD